MHKLFEYQNATKFLGKTGDLEAFLNDVWKKSNLSRDSDNYTSKTQQFISFEADNHIKSRNYVGIISYNNEKIYLLPKVFYDKNRGDTSYKIRDISDHILWWLSYSKSFKFRGTRSMLGGRYNNFFEVLIYLFAKETKEVFQNQLYLNYNETSEELSYVKGRIDMPAYIKNNLARARWHKIYCIHEPFTLDNKFNQIVKYVAKNLYHTSEDSDNKKLLTDILDILHDVSDTYPTAEDCRRIHFNIYHEALESVRDYCQLFLDNSISSLYNENFKVFAFLLPMERIFEEFLRGFIEEKLKGIIKIESSNGVIHIDKNKKYPITPDMILLHNEKRILADAKYKLLEEGEKPPRSDIYQIISYATRLGIKNSVLLFPKHVGDVSDPEPITIISDQNDQENIVTEIRFTQVPIISENLITSEEDNRATIENKFKAAEENLKEFLNNCFLNLID